MAYVTKHYLSAPAMSAQSEFDYQTFNWLEKNNYPLWHKIWLYFISLHRIFIAIMLHLYVMYISQWRMFCCTWLMVLFSHITVITPTLDTIPKVQITPGKHDMIIQYGNAW